MPTATPFKALGAGNGFPTCIPEVDVDDFDHWTTLSGVNKNSPESSDSLIEDSFQLAMKLYWNLFKINGEAAAYRSSSSEGTETVFTDLSVSDASTSDQPGDRICGGPAYGENSDFGGGLVRIRFSGGLPVRMVYDGELVGYGWSSFMQALGYPSGGPSSSVNISGYVVEEVEKTYDYWVDPDNVELEYDYVTLGEMHFVCFAYADGAFFDPSYTTLNVNASGKSASAEYYYENENVVDNRTSEASLSGTEFYTYT